MPHEERLKAANDAILAGRKDVKKEFYPLYHIAPYTCWMSAPASLVEFNGVYHIYFEHNPFAPTWGSMHWGHVSSDDLVHWRHHPVALAPGDDWDRDGCFAGSTVVHDDKLYAFYTGHHWMGESADSNQIYQVQCLAVSEDGFSFEKRGIVVKPPSRFTHFRDPKVWFECGRWWMACGASDAKDEAYLLLYNTDDLEDWDDSTFAVLSKMEDKNISMLESPDFFELGGQRILIVSPQGMRSATYDFRNYHQSGYYCGTWCAGQAFVNRTAFHELDRGHDFYCPQTFATRDGRRILIGWLNMWNSAMPTRAQGWCGMLSIPRELSVDAQSGRLLMCPIRELESARQARYTIGEQVIRSNSTVLLEENCHACELKITFNAANSLAEKYGLWLGSGMELYVDTQAGRLVLNRHYPQYVISGYRSCELPAQATLFLHVFIDQSSVEVFVNDGSVTFSSRIYPASTEEARSSSRRLAAFAVNGTAHLLSADLWPLVGTVLQ